MVLHIYRPGATQPVAGPISGDVRQVARAARRYERLLGACVIVTSDEDRPA